MISRPPAAELVPVTPPPVLSTGFTAIVLLAAPVPAVFREIADIENLPRWAGGFCERLELSHGRWVGLTSLGELYLALETSERAGEVTLRAGWSASALYPVPLRVTALPGGGTRLHLAVPAVADPDHARLCHALRDELLGLLHRLTPAVLPDAEWRSN